MRGVTQKGKNQNDPRRKSPGGAELSKQAERRCPHCKSAWLVQSKMSRVPKRPSKAAAIAELWRVTETAATKVSRDYFRANSGIGDGWSVHWPTFKTFLKAFDDAVSEENDLYYEALVELVAQDRQGKGGPPEY